MFIGESSGEFVAYLSGALTGTFAGGPDNPIA
jgi:hypothetical protein